MIGLSEPSFRARCAGRSRENSERILVIPDDVCVHGGHEQSDGNEAGDFLRFGQYFRRRAGFLESVVSSVFHGSND
jgi:hypothetical protein